jgi:hypothetical protein
MLVRGSRHARDLWVGLGVVAVFTACGDVGKDPDVTNPNPSGGVPDAGVPPSDSGGATSFDTGTGTPPSTPDSSSPPRDSGGPPPRDDSGSPVDASVPPLDGASPDSASPDAAPPTGDAAPPQCGVPFPTVTDFGAPGTFTVTKDTTSTAPASCTVFRPSVLGEGGRKHPVIVWGNGTGTPTVDVYDWLFNQWTSHGFIVAAANTSSAGTGQDMLDCLTWVESQDKVSGSVFEGHVAVGRAGSSGHSQGGGGAIMTGRDPRIVATVPFMAYTLGLGHDPTSQSQQHGPMLLMSGSADTIAPPDTNQKPVFQNSNVATFWGILSGADHVTFALGGIPGYLAPSTAWFRLHLMCDETARPMFYDPSCTMCSDSKWAVQRKNM